MAPANKPWQVRCDDYTSWHRTRAQAERHLADVEHLGACRLPHTIVPPPRRVVAIHDKALPEWWVGATVERETKSLYHLLRHSHSGRKPSRRTVRKELVTVEEA